MNTLGRLRRAAGFKSASAFAKHMDIPQATYSRYENQPVKIPTAALIRIANELNCSIDDILERSSDSTNSSSEKLQPIQFRCSNCNELYIYEDLTSIELSFTKGTYTGSNLDDASQRMVYTFSLCDSCRDKFIMAMNDIFKNE